MDWIQVFLSTTLAIVLWFLFFSDRKRNNLINKLPGPKAYPIIGNMLDLMVSSDKIIPNALVRAKKYGSIFRLWVGSIPVVAVSSPEMMEVILSSQTEIRKGFVYRFVSPWLGDGLLTSTGQKWFKHRKMLTPTFHFSILETFIPVFESNCEIFVKKLEELADTDKVFDIFPFVTKCALDMICETAMGINVNAQQQEGSEYCKAIYKFSTLVVKRGQRIYLHSDTIFKFTPIGREYYDTLKILHGFTNSAIRQRKELRSNQKTENNFNNDTDEFGKKKRKAFLDLLLDIADTAGLTEEQVREEVDTFMFEGHDTTSAGLSWTLYLLGRHPEIQEQVYQEINDIIGDDKREFTLAELNSMKLLERCIKESLRIHPSVPFVSRTLDNDVQFGKYLIPKNTVVSVGILNLHMNPDVWPDPEKFNPDRFLPENIQKKHPYAYIPFSAGPRNCIGQKFALQEEKIVLARFLQNYRIQSVEKESDIIPMGELILRPKNGVNVKIFKRML